MDIVAGTAGHIDHGKTSLIRALTGTDTDRLPEERRRGITIDIGFAEMHEGGTRVGFVDVPGHERFVRNMLAGASGIDLVILTIAADEGVMPQTREHFDICRLLHLDSGIIVFTKSDLADAETLEIVRLEARELTQGTFLENAPEFVISSKTGEGIAELRQALLQTAESRRRRPDEFITRLPIDRSFTVKGFGTVVTGTLISGSIPDGSELELLPEGQRLRVRGIQTHGSSVTTAEAGRRTAVNLAGIDHSYVRRGMMLAEPGVLAAGQNFDCEIDILASAARPLKARQRVRIHIGTAEVLARVAIVGSEQQIEPGSKGFAHVRLESPVVAVHGDRFIIRSYSPQMTIGGGTILRPAPDRLRRRDIAGRHTLLAALSAAAGDASLLAGLLIDAAGETGLSQAEFRAMTGLRTGPAAAAMASAQASNCGGVYVSIRAFQDLTERARRAIAEHHAADKMSRGLPLKTLRESVLRQVRPEVERAVLAELASDGSVVIDRDVVKLGSHAAKLSPAEQAAFDKIRETYADAGLNVPKTADALTEAAKASGLGPVPVRKVLQMLLDAGDIIRVSDEFCFSAAALDDLKARVGAYAATVPGRSIDVAAFKDLAGISRKYAIPLLEYLDGIRFTARSGDKRIVL